jgi:hypothetical protein
MSRHKARGREKLMVEFSKFSRHQQSMRKKPPNESDPRLPFPEEPQLSTVLELLHKILLNGTNENRRYCKYCNAKMIMPIELHRNDCVWRLAWKLINENKSK